MLKWEEEEEKPYSGRWIILVAYLMDWALSTPFESLIIPVGFCLLFKKYEVSTKGYQGKPGCTFTPLAYGICIDARSSEVAGWFELLFVNVLGLPYNSGLVFFMIIYLVRSHMASITH